jgi:hypothetical protein
VFERLEILLLISGTKLKLAIIVRGSLWFSTILQGKCVKTGHDRFLSHSSWFSIHHSLPINPTDVLAGFIYIYIYIYIYKTWKVIQSGVTVTQKIVKESSIEGLYWFECKVKPLGASHRVQSGREVQLHSFLA